MRKVNLMISMTLRSHFKTSFFFLVIYIYIYIYIWIFLRSHKHINEVVRLYNISIVANTQSDTCTHKALNEPIKEHF